MTLSYTNIFFYEMRKQKVWFRAVWIYNLIFFHHSLDSPKTSFQPVTTSQLHSPNVNQSCCCYYSGNLITSWAPKPSKVPLAWCTVEFDPENIRFWMKRLSTFHNSPQLLHFKNVGSCRKIVHYSENVTGHLSKLVIKLPARNYCFDFALTFIEWLEMLPKRKSYTSKKYD